MQQIADWLAKIGLEQYASLLAEHHIDVDIFPALTADDLEKIGIPLGHRKKILSAIAEFEKSKPAIAKTSEPERASEPERRQLTVMFCDLVGSTALSSQLDPEDMREVLRAYRNACANVMPIYEGFVARFLGDGILAYFGYPNAHEDDAERAVRAALDIVQSIQRLRQELHINLQVRIGIATGLVVVGDLIGAEGATEEKAVIGETPNLAARLQTLADPDAVVVAASTRRLLGEVFRLRDLGSHNAKGFPDPIRAWAVEGLATSESRFEARRSPQLTDLVGREQEIGLLLERKNAAWHGEAQAVLICGEPGIGKSHIIAALCDRIASEQHLIVRYQCSPYHQNSTLYPFINQIEKAAEITPNDSPEQRIEKLEAILAPGTPQTAATLLATILWVPDGINFPALELGPRQQRRQTFAAVIGQLEALASQKPLLLIFEDMHWADTTSLELIGLIIQRVRNLPIMTILTTRPGFETSWADNVTTLNLGRLNPAHVQVMIKQVAGDCELSGELVEEIIAKTDGIPLFIEELTKAVTEARLPLEHAKSVNFDGPRQLAIPATLQDSLMARLDRLGWAKQIAQTGAAIGREFALSLLCAVTEQTHSDIIKGLERLENAELVFRRYHATEPVYVFKHALICDAAYESMLKSRRRTLHQTIGRALCNEFPTVAANSPEVVAHHFTVGGVIEEAVQWWTKAGEAMLQRFAYNEAVAQLEKARELARSLADGADQRLIRLKLQTTYGQALLYNRGHGSPDTTLAFIEAREIAAKVETAVERFSAYYGMWVGSLVRADLTPMRDVAEAFLKDVQPTPDSPEAGVAHRIFGSTCWFQGDFEGARLHLERSLAIHQGDPDHQLATHFGYHSGVMAMVNLAPVLFAMGYADRPERLIEIAANIAVASGHIPSIAIMHHYACVFSAICHKPLSGLSHAEALVGLGQKHGLPQALARGKFLLGWARWALGQPEGEEAMREGLALLNEMNLRSFEPFDGTLLAELEVRAGRPDKALATLDTQLATVEATGERWFHAEMYRVRGEILQKHEPISLTAIELAFLHAIDIARGQKAWTFELRAKLSLAKLYQSINRTEASRSLIESALADFWERVDLPELAEAKYLLAQLG